MNPIIFREYDIRGVVGPDLVPEQTYDLGRAIVHYYLEKNQASLKLPPARKNITTMIVGMDGRTHSPQLKDSIVSAITDCGIDVIDIGICPTPAFYFATHTLSASTGIMVTASHNPKQYNGFKLCLDKKTVWGTQIQQIRQLFEQGINIASPSIKKGKVTSYDIISDYLAWLHTHFSHLRNLEINAVIDCGSGTACTVIPDLVTMMGWRNVSLLCDQLDGTFPNHTADPTVAKNMVEVKDALHKDSSMTIGIGFDGDCDRVAPMCSNGYLVPGDQVLALFSQSVLESHPNASIVYDVKSSASLINALNAWGAQGHISPCGHSIIKESMVQHNAILGGELSCHFFFNDRYFGYDDGIYAALRLIELILKSGKTLQDLVDELPQQISSPEVRIPCQEIQKKEIVAYVKSAFDTHQGAQLITIDGVRVQTAYGWGLIRASNTQAELSLRFESETKDGLHRIKTDFSTILAKYFEPDLLKEKIDF